MALFVSKACKCCRKYKWKIRGFLLLFQGPIDWSSIGKFTLYCRCDLSTWVEYLTVDNAPLCVTAFIYVQTTQVEESWVGYKIGESNEHERTRPLRIVYFYFDLVHFVAVIFPFIWDFKSSKRHCWWRGSQWEFIRLSKKKKFQYSCFCEGTFHLAVELAPFNLG